MQAKLQQLVNKGLLWQADQSFAPAHRYFNTGYSSLDKVLGGGWQAAGLHEWQCQLSFTEQRLLLPLIEQTQQRQLPMFWINPPAQLSAAGLQWQLTGSACHIVVQGSVIEAAWAFEQILHSGVGLAVLWHAQHQDDATMVRRWHKAAQTGEQAGFVVTTASATSEARAYNSRLLLHSDGHRADILKRRYGWPLTGVQL